MPNRLVRMSIAGCLTAVATTAYLGAKTSAAPAAQSQAEPRSAAPLAQPAAAASPQQALINRYCVGCHNQRTRSGNLRLDELDVSDVAKHSETWEKVIRKVGAGMMPPSGMPRPDEPTERAFVAWLGGELDRAFDARPNPGRTETFHRLNRTEYQNTIRDLLSLDIDVSDYLPADDSSYGFDNIAGVLRLSQSLMDRYLSASKTIARMAVGAPPPAIAAATLPDCARFPAERPRPGSSVRHTRRHRVHASLSAGCRVRHQDRNGRRGGGTRRAQARGDGRRCAGQGVPVHAGHRARVRGRVQKGQWKTGTAGAGEGGPSRGRRHVLQKTCRSRGTGARAVPEPARRRRRRRHRRVDADGHECFGRRARTMRPVRATRPAAAEFSSASRRRRRRRRRAPSESSRSWLIVPIAAPPAKRTSTPCSRFSMMAASRMAASRPGSSSPSAGSSSTRISCSASRPTRQRARHLRARPANLCRGQRHRPSIGSATSIWRPVSRS